MVMDKKYIGLWKSESPKAGTYLASGWLTPEFEKGAKDGEGCFKFFVFTNKDDPNTRRISRLEDGEFEDIGTVTQVTNDFGVYFQGSKFDVTKNRFYEEGTKQPTHTLVIK